MGTNQRVILSAKAWIGILVPCASFIKSIIWDRKDSSPTLSTLALKVPVRFREPPVTLLPLFLLTGKDSPVIIDSSTEETPSSTFPSTGILSPGLTKTKNPALTASIGMVNSPSENITRASFAWSLIRAFISLAALSRRCDSINLPVSKNKGSKVTGGSLNLTGTFKVRVNKIGEESFLSQMIDLIKEAQGTKIPIQAIADRITLWFVPTIITLALVSGIIWYFQFNEFQGFLSYMRGLFPWILNTDSSVSFAVFAFISTIVIACLEDVIQ
ncbi:hypothetical protein ES708_23705 [subsurface metagenome]